MASVTIHKAKTELSKLISRVEAGEEILIMRRDKPVARLTSAKAELLPKRVFGQHPEFAAISDEVLFAATPDDEITLWDGRD
ncbi:MAG: type II toxin-antitoxin system Phd/YefM family antitoxin [Rhizobiaceae bacterium]